MNLPSTFTAEGYNICEPVTAEGMVKGHLKNRHRSLIVTIACGKLFSTVYSIIETACRLQKNHQPKTKAG
jgi:hypothetical protein